jgi:predicted aconitase with swiveling domain
MDMSLEILDHNIEKIPGDVIFHKNNKYSELQSYVIYAACKHQDQVIAIISLID